LGKAGVYGLPEGGGRAGIGGLGATGGKGSAGGAGADAGAGAVGGFPCAGGEQAAPGFVTCGGGFAHRPMAAACPPPPPDLDYGEPGSGGEGGETTSHCNESCGEGEACIWSDPAESERAHCARVCETDLDCGRGSVCACVPGLFRTPFEPTGGLTVGLCTESTCTVDADCEPGALCIAPFSPSDCGLPWPHEFHCQTPDDECASVADCNDQDCDYVEGRFVCGNFAEHC
jgi:hypothetical protein